MESTINFGIADVRSGSMGDIERFFELKEVANRGLISRRYPTVVSAGPFCELTTFALTAA